MRSVLRMLRTNTTSGKKIPVRFFPIRTIIGAETYLEVTLMSDCIFCRIAAGEIPSATIYEDENFRVILDLGPATKGHALILPKAHYADLTEIPEDLAAKAMVVAKKVVTFMKDALPCDGYNIVQNNGETAGQTVHHFHMHVIPRYKNDGQRILWRPNQPTGEELDGVLQKILD